MQIRRPHRNGGFTLIELMVVVGIIVILLSLIAGGLSIAKGKVKEAQARTDIQNIGNGLQLFYNDYGYYPGHKVDPDPEHNAFPLLFTRLLGRPGAAGGGGKSAPYIDNIQIDRVVYYDDPEDYENWESVDNEMRYDKDIDKYYLDPWSMPYQYRENESKKNKERWMIKPEKFDLWSFGPNEENESVLGYDPTSKENNDDIGNWR